MAELQNKLFICSRKTKPKPVSRRRIELISLQQQLVNAVLVGLENGEIDDQFGDPSLRKYVQDKFPTLDSFLNEISIQELRMVLLTE